MLWRSTPTTDSPSLRQLLNALEEFRALGIDFVSLHEGVDTSTPNDRRLGSAAAKAEAAASRAP